MGQLDPEEDNIQEEVERVVAKRYARLDPSFVTAAPDRTGKVELKRIVKELEAEVKIQKNYVKREQTYLKSEKKEVVKQRRRYEIAIKLLSCEESYSKCLSNPEAKYFEEITKLYEYFQWKDCREEREEEYFDLPQDTKNEFEVYEDLYEKRAPPVRQSITSPKRKRGSELVQQNTPSLMDNDFGANGNVESVSNSSSQVSGTKRRRVHGTKPAVNEAFEEGIHVCQACEGCSQETRADCARDQGVPVHANE